MNPSSSTATHRALIRDAQSRPGNDPIFALHGEATERAARGESILNATLGALLHDDRSLAVMDSASEAFVAVPNVQAAGYAPISGDAPFLDAVVADLVGEGDLADRAVAVATAGATGALHHAIANFVEPGQAVLTTQYFWGPYIALAEHGRKRIETFSMFNDQGRFDTDAFGASLHAWVETQGRALALLNFPCHNPTGYSLDEQEWAAVADHVNAVGKLGPVALLIDYAYGSFGSPSANGWRSHLSTMVESATVLFAWTASKAFTQYGSRVGALVALHDSADERAAIAGALGYSCRGTWSNCNHRGLLAVTRLLRDPELAARAASERADLVELLDRRVRLFNELASQHELRYPRYEGGFFVSVFTPDSMATAARMRELGVYVVPIPGAVRVALCATPLPAVPRLVEALAAGVAAAESGNGEVGGR